MTEFLQAFTPDERLRMEIELSCLVRDLQGRKLEEADWNNIYCRVKGCHPKNWSNLSFRDYYHQGVGVEFKMLCRKNPSHDMGRTLMHPSATRTISFNPDGSADEAAHMVMTQWRKTIEDFRQRVALTSTIREPDLRWGVLLWTKSHSEFLYFETRLECPDFFHFQGQWIEGKHRGNPTRNLCIFDKNGRKHFTCTLPKNGSKLQPYFDIPTIEQGSELFRFSLPPHVPLYVSPTTAKSVRDISPGWSADHILNELLSLHRESQLFKNSKTVDS
jgi:hypothetical protein